MTKNQTQQNQKTSSTSNYAVDKYKAGVQHLSEEEYNKKNHPTTKNKTLILVRHGMSTANEFMDQPGNRWGDATFKDDANLIDASLSAKGVTQAEELCKRLKESSLLLDNDDSDDSLLVVTSPLTRCIETMTIGVLPNLPSLSNDNQHQKGEQQTKKILVQPLATERIYTASDTGRPVEILKNEYTHLDFDTCFEESGIDKQLWWYSHDNTNNKRNKESYKEWRPHEEGQYYAVPGEPLDVFNKRMIQLFEWIKSREEEKIILVCHWGVIRWLTGEDVKNCHVKEIMFDRLIVKEEIFQSLL